MVQTKYLVVLAIATAAAVVVVAVFASGILSKDNEKAAEEHESDDIKITLTINGPITSVTHNGVNISSGVPFYVPESENCVSLQTKMPSAGYITLKYWSELNPGISTTYSGESDGPVTFNADINRDIHSGNIVGEITFEPGSIHA